MLKMLSISATIMIIIPINIEAAAASAFEGIKYTACVGAPCKGNIRINPQCNKGNSENVQNDNT